MNWESLLKENSNLEDRMKKLLTEISRLKERMEDETELTGRLRVYVERLRKKVEELEGMLE